ncbi:MAG TPA: GNAT family N-acetyltransferase [Flavisolibacter sp.]
MACFIRRATKDDAMTIAEISHQTFFDTFGAVNRKEDMEKFLSQQFTKGKLMLEVGAAQNIFLMAYVDDQLCGYVKLRDGEKPPQLRGTEALEIARIYTIRTMTGKGIGSDLMRECIDIAASMKKSVVWLGVWERNRKAIDFYHKWGFEKFGETAFLLGDDLQTDWLMKRNVS